MAQRVAGAPALLHEDGAQSWRLASGPHERHHAHRYSYGAVDLGTNNCRLLIARPVDGGFTVVDAFSRVVRLGEGLSQSGKLSDEAMDRAVAALAICGEKLRRRNVSLSRAVATEACRRAVNGRDFTERVREETGIDLRHRRRLDRTGTDRPCRWRAQDPQLVERSVGSGFADRE